jgi:hypothetical protein
VDTLGAWTAEDAAGARRLIGTFTVAVAGT